MKRFLVATAIFFGSVLLLSLPGLFQIYRTLTEDHVAFGFYFALGPPGAVLTGIAFLMVVATLSYWVSGKLVKARR
jgi:hypothetical protein